MRQAVWGKWRLQGERQKVDDRDLAANDLVLAAWPVGVRDGWERAVAGALGEDVLCGGGAEAGELLKLSLICSVDDYRASGDGGIERSRGERAGW